MHNTLPALRRALARRLFPALVVPLAALLAACGGGDDGGAESASVAPVTESTAATSPLPASTPADVAVTSVAPVFSFPTGPAVILAAGYELPTDRVD